MYSVKNDVYGYEKAIVDDSGTVIINIEPTQRTHENIMSVISRLNDSESTNNRLRSIAIKCAEATKTDLSFASPESADALVGIVINTIKMLSNENCKLRDIISRLYAKK